MAGRRLKPGPGSVAAAGALAPSAGGHPAATRTQRPWWGCGVEGWSLFPLAGAILLGAGPRFYAMAQPSWRRPQAPSEELELIASKWIPRDRSPGVFSSRAHPGCIPRVPRQPVPFHLHPRRPPARPPCQHPAAGSPDRLDGFAGEHQACREPPRPPGSSHPRQHPRGGAELLFLPLPLSPSRPPASTRCPTRVRPALGWSPTCPHGSRPGFSSDAGPAGPWKARGGERGGCAGVAAPGRGHGDPPSPHLCLRELRECPDL